MIEEQSAIAASTAGRCWLGILYSFVNFPLLSMDILFPVDTAWNETLFRDVDLKNTFSSLPSR